MAKERIWKKLGQVGGLLLRHKTKPGITNSPGDAPRAVEVCRWCGEDIDDRWDICPYCGYDLSWVKRGN